MSILIVSGTGTDIGKTVATAALAACATGSVAVVKPIQTGVREGEPGDLAEVTRLTGITEVHEFRRYPEPLSPHHAARDSGLPELTDGEAVLRIVDLANQFDNVIVEGAGGLLVPYDNDTRWTLVDLAHELEAPVMVVTAPGLGTLNHTTLTVERLHEESLELAGIMLGSWPREPDLAMRYGIVDIRRLCGRSELAGVLPAGMSAMRDFTEQARAALAPEWGGTFDWQAFRAAQQI
ncbi:dethiobiotin synthase [Jatrophihabitans sp.]|uniref:dethiobiotin synthase n=1 Tax=Jatrophihabitans sp. TaxID=1932789 RepID=UPI0030C6BC14|nr:dethiobiotin synthase [Jatrophihabitans sp.]